MTQRSLRLILLLLVLLPALVLAQTNQPGKLSVAEYNVEWMLDAYNDPYTKDEAMPPKPRKELEAIASAIRALNADVVALEEVENEGLLKVFTHDMLADMGYQYIAVQPTNSDRGQNLGLLSRVPIISLTSHRFMDLKLDHSDKTWRFVRDLLQVRLQVTPRRTLDLFITHFKSKRDDEGDPKSAKWRLAEATAARKLLDEELQANPYNGPQFSDRNLRWYSAS